MDDAYKAMAEARLKDNTGSDLVEMTGVTLSLFYAPVVLKWCVVDRFLPGNASVDAVFYPLMVMGVIQLPWAGVWVATAALVLHAAGAWRAEAASGKDGGDGKTKKDFIYSLVPFRGLLMAMTVYSILAVDFRIYPKQHMKTEVFGFSGMDLGVGVFVFSHGLVMGPKVVADARRACVKWVQTSLPLCVCGVLRVVAVKALNYQEHVTEYGVHWNFFFTLALVPIFFRALLAVNAVAQLPPVVLAVLPTAVHQVWLTVYGGFDYLLDDARASLVDQNKEGVFGLCGYTSLFMLGSYFSGPLRDRRAPELWIFAGAAWATFLALEATVQPCSRRACNAAYVALTCSQGGAALTLLQHLPDFERFSASTTPPDRRYLGAVSRHGFFVFLVSNLLTGAVNLACRTLDVAPFSATALLVVYLLLGPQLPLALLEWKGKSKST
eukprot:TRINITY_DN6886_c0_g2_i4.p1 TRINITY_DN6886_c0_g2~~TRINITY_DN6886_c0_g2_i4.p1  ORF type:complete len:438 (+),score=161.84 TRINITY_DN6886_c0_g2_i4:60-1373(+)